MMKIEEAILYVLAERNGGLRTEQIADIINRRKLHVRKDGRTPRGSLYTVRDPLYKLWLRIEIVGKA